MDAAQEPFWSIPASEMLAGLGSSVAGLATAEAEARLERSGPNLIVERHGESALRLLLKQFRSPLVLILIFGAGVSMVLREWMDASIILAIVTGSCLLGFFQEYRASRAVQALRARLELTALAIRDGASRPVPVRTLVPGDIVLLSAGNLVPADGLILEANDFLVTEASLTGESLPVEKSPGVTPETASIGQRTNAVFMGSSVRSGTARVLIVETGERTSFGAIAARLQRAEGETDFARGVRHFGGMLLRVMIVIVLAVVTVNQLLGRPVEESLLFGVALAVGLSPELLPAIISVTLSTGARHLSKGGVIVRRLESIENLGSMDVLCTDKTGTLTEGTIALHDTIDADGHSDEGVRLAAFLNASFESGIENPLDAAIVAACPGLSLGDARKVDEIPYDFARRRLTVVVEQGGDTAHHRMITKGAFDHVLAVCSTLRRSGTTLPLDKAERSRIEAIFSANGKAGLKVLGIAEKILPGQSAYARDDEKDLTFLGMILFADPPKEEAAGTIRALAELGIRIKVISGDNRYVTAHVARAVGLDPCAMLTGEELSAMTDQALWAVASDTDLFVEIDPQQKERIVRVLQRRGHSLGYLGDGINDAPALKAADVGVSVENAVDVARESADVILLSRNLEILRQGVADGRRIFANTLKYISITTSANFGNMISMALATPLLPFLPLLPKQILLNNFLSDLPSIAISSDNVDAEHIAAPQRWDVREVQRFMIVFGLVSSCFDGLTFAALLMIFRAGETEFQTSWFIVSLLTELAVVLVLRTRGFALRSRPSNLLLWSTILVSAATLALPYLGFMQSLFGFIPLPPRLMLVSVAIVALYVAATEVTKAWFYRKRSD